MLPDAPPAPPLCYPRWLALLCFAWTLAGWLLAVLAPRMAFMQGVELLHLVLPCVTAGLILANLGFSLHALYRRNTPVERLLLVTALQIGLFTTLFHQLAAHVGSELYWTEGPTRPWLWVQFSLAHALRASDVLDAIEAFGLNIQTIKHRSPLVGALVVGYHVVIDLFMLGLFWALLTRLRDRFLSDPRREKAIRTVGLCLFGVWVVVWLACALWLRPWRLIDIPLWLAENVVRVADFADAMDSFNVHWHQVPRELPESTLTLFCRVWVAVGISLLVAWWARRGQAPLAAKSHRVALTTGGLWRLGAAAALLAAVVGVDAAARLYQAGHVDVLAEAACGEDEARAAQALAALRRLGVDAEDAISPLAEFRASDERTLAILRTLGYLGPKASEALRRAALAEGAAAEDAVSGLLQLGPTAAPALVVVWAEAKEEWAKERAELGLRDFGTEAMPSLMAATDRENAKDHMHWFNELDRNWTLRSGNAIISALKRLHANPRFVTEKDEMYASWVTECGSAAVARLIEGLEQSDVPGRKAAAEALGRIGPGAKDAVDPLVKALADNVWEVCRAAERTLVKIGPVAVNPLIKALLNKNGDVRLAAAWALERIDNRWAGSVAIPFLTKALADKEGHVRVIAAEALGKIGPGAKDAVAPLVKALADKEGQVRFAAKMALVKIGPVAVNPLIKALADKEAHVRAIAAEALGEIGLGAKGAVAPLVNALADKNWDVHRGAKMALVKIGPVAVNPLIRALANDAVHVRSAAAGALGEIGTGAKGAVAPLVNALADKEGQVRATAAVALGQIGPGAKNAVTPLVKALADNDWTVRRAAAEALGGIGPGAKDAVDPLVKTLADGELHVGKAAVGALLRIGLGSKDGVAPLVKALAAKDWEVRFAAVAALGYFGPEAVDALPDLKRVSINDEVIAVRATAKHAIEKIRKPK